MSFFKDIRTKYLLIFIVALAQYANTANHDYAWDDAIVLTQNSRVQKGLSNIPELFENIKTQKIENRYGYRPISLLSFATDVQLFGMNPAAAHKVNILLYALLCVLIFYFLQLVFPNDPWRNFIIAMLFVVHPLHTEVVANIKSRDEMLAMLFGMGGLLFFHRAKDSKPILFYSLGCLALLFSFLCKESGITFCGVAILLAWLESDNDTVRKRLARFIPAFAAVLLLLAVRSFVYSDAFFESEDFTNYRKGIFLQEGFVGNPLLGIDDMLTRAANIFYLAFLYLVKFIIPYPLIHDYSYNQLPLIDWSHTMAWVSMIALLTLLFIGLRGLWKRTMYGFGIMLFFAGISIYLHVVQLAPDLFAERFMFVPSLGISMALVVGVFQIKRLRPSHRNMTFGMICLVFFTMSWKRNYAWKDNETLFRTDLPKLENCVRSNYNFALLLHDEYYRAPENEKIRLKKDIIKHYERAFALSDRMFNIYMDLGGAYMEFGFSDKGKEVFEKAMVRYPKLSIPYVQMAKYYMSFNDFARAVPYLEKAKELGEANSDFYYLLGICLFNTDREEEAIDIVVAGEKLGVSTSAYYSLMARMYRKLAMNQQAVAALQRGVRQFPEDVGLNKDLQFLLQETGSSFPQSIE